MPAVVDHEARRRHVVDAAHAILASGGLAALTVRDVARAAGFSTAVVSHYFRDKNELLLLTFRRNVEEAAAAAERALAASGGDLKALIAEAMPLDTLRIDRWRVWLAYIAQLAEHPEIASLQRDSAADRLQRLAELLQAGVEAGTLRADLQPAVAAGELLSVIMGLAIQVLFDPAGWPPERQHDVVDAVLGRLQKRARTPP